MANEHIIMYLVVVAALAVHDAIQNPSTINSY